MKTCDLQNIIFIIVSSSSSIKNNNDRFIFNEHVIRTVRNNFEMGEEFKNYFIVCDFQLYNNFPLM